MSDASLIAFCTFPDPETAEKIVREIVATHLAACGNILPNISSIYWWQGKVESSLEVLAIFKLSSAGYQEFEAALRRLHPYEMPEIIACKIEEGSSDYLRWINESCRSKT